MGSSVSTESEDFGQGIDPQQGSREGTLAVMTSDIQPPIVSDSISSRGGVAALIHGAHAVYVNGGTFSVTGRDTINVNHFHTSEPRDSDLVSKIQDWLAPNINYRAIQIDTLSKHVPGTGSWFLRSEMFQIWLRNKGNILWGTGMPGAGKTILASIIIDHLQMLVRNTRKAKISVVFAYCRYTDPISARDILAALVVQLLERNPSLVELVEPIYRQHTRDRTQPSQSELVNLLHEAAQMFDANFYVLDGLDEAPEDTKMHLLDIFSSLKVNIIITSRLMKKFEWKLPGATFFDVVAHEDDILLLISHKIATLEPLLVSDALKQEIITKILERSNGMFIHAALQLETLQHCLNIAEVREALDAFPPELEDMYAVTVGRIERQPAKHATLAKLVLTLVLYTTRPLTIEELQYSTAASLETNVFDPDRLIPEALLVSVCCGLIALENKGRRVRLIHFTAKDALQPILLRDFPYPHELLAATCISRLISCSLHESDIKFERDLNILWSRNPLLKYAYDSWHIHSKSCDRQIPQFDKIRQFVRSCKSYPIVIFVSALFFQRELDYCGPFHVAAHYDLHFMLDELKDNFEYNMPTPATQSTPLMISLTSSREGFEVSSKSAMLLLEFPDIQVNAISSEGMTALHWASCSGYEDVVERLLKFPGIEINGAEGFEGSTALMLACQHGHEGIANQLLRHPGIDIDVTDKDGWKVLSHAMYFRCKEVEKQLLAMEA